MESYFAVIPGELLIEICLYLDFLDLLDFYQFVNSPQLTSKSFWISKYNVDFIDLNWKYFTKGPSGDNFLNEYTKYMSFRVRYDTKKLIMDNLRKNHYVVDSEMYFINIPIGDVSKIFTIDGKKEVSKSIRDQLDSITSQIPENEIIQMSLGFDRKLGKYSINIYHLGTKYQVFIEYPDAFDIQLYANEYIDKYFTRRY